MKQQEGISVIIPMYNAQLYIERSVQSVLRQGKVICEVICVDDGSTDQTCQIVERLQKSEIRIVLIKLNHTGVSHARNFGTNKASGRYVMYMDADDYLLPKRLEALYKKACNCDADILVFGGRAEDRWHAPEWVQRVTNTRNRLCYGMKPELLFEERGVFPVTWNKLYKREYIGSYKFPEQLSVAEDNVFQFWAFLYAKRVVFVSTKVYVYCLNANSVMGKTDKESKTLQHSLAVDLVQRQLEQNDQFVQYRDAFVLWKEMLVGSNVCEKNWIIRVLSFIKSCGLRSAFERAIGKYFIK